MPRKAKAKPAIASAFREIKAKECSELVDKLSTGELKRNPKPSFGDFELEMVDNFQDLLADENDTAVVSAAIKILDAIKDPKTPEALREKLMVIGDQARDALLDKAKTATVATARGNANAYILKRQQDEAPSVWPPNTETAKWKKDYNNAQEQCGMQSPPTTPTPTTA